MRVSAAVFGAWSFIFGLFLVPLGADLDGEEMSIRVSNGFPGRREVLQSMETGFAVRVEESPNVKADFRIREAAMAGHFSMEKMVRDTGFEPVTPTVSR